ncbi:MAG: hypothetical protein AB7V43_05230 [Acidimicrobiia bacterium]
MVESIQAAASGIQAAAAMLDDSARQLEVPMRTVASQAVGGTGDHAPQTDPTKDGIAYGPDGTAVRSGPTTDLSGQPTGEWPPGSVFAPGFLHADRRGLVEWPGLDAQVSQYLAKRSVAANAAVFRHAQEAYAAINALAS